MERPGDDKTVEFMSMRAGGGGEQLVLTADMITASSDVCSLSYDAVRTSEL
jgi:hypothetical protein